MLSFSYIYIYTAFYRSKKKNSGTQTKIFVVMVKISQLYSLESVDLLEQECMVSNYFIVWVASLEALCRLLKRDKIGHNSD